MRLTARHAAPATANLMIDPGVGDGTAPSRVGGKGRWGAVGAEVGSSGLRA